VDILFHGPILILFSWQVNAAACGGAQGKRHERGQGCPGVNGAIKKSNFLNFRG
jgi:hypothetical protein